MGRPRSAAFLALASLACGPAAPAPEAPPSWIDLRPALADGSFPLGAVHAGAWHHRALFDEAWYAPQPREPMPELGCLRGDGGSSLSLFVADPGPRILELELLPTTSATQTVRFEWNGRTLATRELEADWNRVAFPLEAGDLRVGRNELRLVPSSSEPYDGRQLSIAAARVALFPEEAPPPTPLPTRVPARGEVAPDRLSPGEWRRLELLGAAGRELALDLEVPPGAELLARLVPVDPGRVPGEVLEEARLPPGSHRLRWELELEEEALFELQLALIASPGSPPAGLERLALRPPQRRPDLLVAVVDTLRADHVWEGPSPTPTLDALAAEGVPFREAYSHASLTLPSHTALFSSRHPHQTGVLQNGVSVGRDLPLLAEHLQRLGYRTRAVISMGTLQVLTPLAGLDRGFHTFDQELADDMSARWANERVRPLVDALAAEAAPSFLFVHYADPHMPYRAHGSVTRPVELHFRGEPLATLDAAEVVSWSTSLTLRPGANRLVLRGETRFQVPILKAKGADGRPRRLTFEDGALLSPTRRLKVSIENPGDAPEEVELSLWVNDLPGLEENRRRYEGEVSFADAGLAELFGFLREAGRWEESLVVFTSDHGQGLGDHGYERHGQELWQEQIHVPLIFKLPRDHPSQERLTEAAGASIARHIDVVPTLLELGGLPPLPGQTGASLLDPLERLLVAETHGFVPRPVNRFALTDGRTKLFYRKSEERFELYDLERDPTESDDLYGSEGEAWAEWRATLEGIAAGTLGAGGAVDPELEGVLQALGYTE